MKLRLSWSKLSSWAFYAEFGGCEQCIDALRGAKGTKATAQMMKGTRLHERIEVRSLDPLQLEGKVREWEKKFVVQVDDWLEVSGLVDYRVDDTIVDWKTGKGNEMQLFLYALLLEMQGIEVNKGIIAFIDEDKNHQIILSKRPRKYDIGKKELEIAGDWLFETALQIKNYIESKPRLQKEVEAYYLEAYCSP